MKKAFFIDRDGVINKMVLQKDGLFDSPQTIKQVSLVPGIIEMINWLNNKNIPVIEVSNQPGVALGKMDWQLLENIENNIHSLLNEHGVHIDKVYRCLHHPEAQIKELKIECCCRKPEAGLLFKAAQELDLDLKNSVILGDNVSDMESGKKAGCKTILFFHNEDVLYKVKAKQNYMPQFKIYSLKEITPILIKLF
jgi:mannose-1-phosphate guanylyltransferase/phosphomannomutase